MKSDRTHHSIKADLEKIARQEKAWATTAKIEAIDELKRAAMWELRDYPKFASELRWDAKIAEDFYKLRLLRSKLYKKLAKLAKKSRK